MGRKICIEREREVYLNCNKKKREPSTKKTRRKEERAFYQKTKGEREREGNAKKIRRETFIRSATQTRERGLCHKNKVSSSVRRKENKGVLYFRCN